MEPRTSAGRALLADFEAFDVDTFDVDEYRKTILAIEAQARPAVASEGLRAAPTYAEMILTAHYQHIWPCDGEPCSCHYFEDLAVVRAALASDAGSVGALDVETDAFVALRGAMTLLWSIDRMPASSTAEEEVAVVRGRIRRFLVDPLAALDAERQGE